MPDASQLSIRKLANELHCSRPTALLELLRSGLPFTFENGRYYVDRSAIERIRAARQERIRVA